MTNEEKEEYINFQSFGKSPIYPCDMTRRSEFFSMCPKILYKYRGCDCFTFDSIKKNYLYLSEPFKFDDPFDCLVNQLKEEDKNSLIKRFTDYLILKNKPYLDDETINKYIEEREKEIINNEENGFHFNPFGNKINRVIDNYLNLLRGGINYFIERLNDNTYHRGYENIKQVRVGSLTPSNENKLLWSMYGDGYKGICIEYDFSNLQDRYFYLYPVIYSDKSSNDYTEKFFDMVIGTAKYFTEKSTLESYRQMKYGIGSLYKLIDTKDSCWESQDEWRVVAYRNNDKFHKAKISAVYMGFQIDTIDECKLKKYSKKYKFKLFKMNEPSGSKDISFTEIR